METSGEIDPSAIFSAKGLVAVVSGGGSGIGRAITASLVRTGAKVFILGRRIDVLTDTAKALDLSSTKVVPLRCDITSDASIAAVVQQIQADTGYIDVLVNNAGIASPFFNINTAASVDELSAGLLQAHLKTPDVLAANTTSVIGVTAALLPLLDKGNKRRGWRNGSKLGPADVNSRSPSAAPADVDAADDRSSQIITISSIAGIERHGFTGLAYSASKAGALHLGKVFSTMLAPWNIRSNVILPGLFPSEMTSFLPTTDVPFNEAPTGRAGRVEDVAGFVLYLVGRAGAFVNGAVLLADGGRTSQEPCAA